MPFVWEHAPDDMDFVLHLIRPHIFNPDRYWLTLVNLLHDQLMLTIADHLDVCDDDTCLMCANLLRMGTTFQAHNHTQPSGCACPDHRTLPRRLRLDTFRPTF